MTAPPGRVTRSTTTRDRLRRQVARDRPPCHICHNEIDYNLPHLDRGEYVIDHIVPLNAGGEDTIDNVAAAHRKCNRDKSDKLAEQLEAEADQSGPRVFVTSRTW